MTERVNNDSTTVVGENDDGTLDTAAFFPILAHEVYRLSEVIKTSIGDVKSQSIMQDSELDLSRRAAAQLYNLAEFALMASRSEQKIIKAHPVRFNLVTSISDAIDSLKIAYPDAKTRIRELNFSLTNIDADPVLIEFALSNMLENALKYGSGDIEISVRLENSTVIIQVENLSCIDFLIQEEHGASNTRISWGIGLNLLRQIAKAHGGYFVFEDESHSVDVAGERFKRVTAKIYLPITILE